MDNRGISLKTQKICSFLYLEQKRARTPPQECCDQCIASSYRAQLHDRHGVMAEELFNQSCISFRTVPQSLTMKSEKVCPHEEAIQFQEMSHVWCREKNQTSKRSTSAGISMFKISTMKRLGHIYPLDDIWNALSSSEHGIATGCLKRGGSHHCPHRNKCAPLPSTFDQNLISVQA